VAAYPVSVVRDGNLRVLSSIDYAKVASDSGDEAAAVMLRRIARRKDSVRVEQQRFATLVDRYDNLYYPNVHTKGGADHWPDDPNLKIAGKVHVSVNVHPTYVDVPAALQAVPPIENIVPPMGDPGLRDIASLVERMYFAWKEDVQFETKAHKMATIKALYGRGAAKVVWDEDLGRPDFVLVEQPRNLWMGWRGNDYSQLEWAIYSYYISPEEAVAEYGLDIEVGEWQEDGSSYIYVRNYAEHDPVVMNQRDWMVGSEHGMLEVNDYWYRKPKATPVKGERTEMVTCNVITVGNCIVEETPREEYGGRMPYVPVFNTYIPGLPEGRSDLFDVEQVLREKDERISAGGTMVTKLVGKQFWQLVGPEAPDRVPSGLRPEPDRVVAPGPGNRIEAITPWMPEFQLEAYLARLDRELQDISGLNDLLRGLAPAQVLSSSKAINALVANYEARITLRRRLFYQWRMDVWDLVKEVWAQKNEQLAPVFLMAGRLVVKPPSLTPRDDIEQATMALNLLNGKVWSLERAQDATGVEDPEREQETTAQERQNPAIFPQDVQAQAALMATMQQLQMQAAQMQQMQGPPQAPPGQAEAQAMEAQEARRQAADRGVPAGSPMMNGAGEQGVPPEEASAFRGGEGYNAVNQTMLMEGQPTNRILLQQPLGPEGEEA
jgi:hypothetical protein